MSYIEDHGRKGFKVFREHTADVVQDRKSVQFGCLVTGQDDSASYEIDILGDEAGWFFWDKATRETGAWSQIVPVVAVSGNGIRPVFSQNFNADTSFAIKTVVISSAINDRTKVRAIDGVLPETGNFGFVVQCINQDTFELLYYPATSVSRLLVDWVTGTNYSTKVYGVNEQGQADLANVGTTKDVWRVENNKVFIPVEVEFYENTQKKGKLAFDTNTFPSLNPPDTDFVAETKLAFDGSRWRWYTPVGGGELIQYARIRWFFSVEEDISEGELLVYEGESWVETSELIWIDWRRSASIMFETAGSSVFQVKKIKSNHTRTATTRDLYEVTKCVLGGTQITDLHKIEVAGTMVTGYILSRTNVAFPWTDPVSARITTSIGGQLKDNVMSVRLPGDWNLQGDATFLFLEVSDVSRGLPFYFRPIRPQMLVPEQKLYQSGETVGGNTIATYTRK